MKRLILLTSAAFTAVLSAFAQEKEAVLPRLEIQLTGGGGLSTLMYKVQDDGIWTQGLNKVDGYHSAPLYETTDDGNGKFTSMRPLAVGTSTFNNFGWNAGLGLALHFDEHWGLVSGAEVAYYKGSVAVERLISAQYIEEYNLIQNYTPLTLSQEGPGMIYNRLDNFTEQQQMLYLQIPLMLKFMAPFGAAKAHNFYIAAGGKLGIGLSGTFDQKADVVRFLYHDRYGTQTANSGWVLLDHLNNNDTYYYVENIDVIKNAGPTAPEKYSPAWDYKGKMQLGLNAMASVELGFRWRLSDALGLYTGIYADYGLLNPVKASGKALYQNDPTWITETEEPMLIGQQDWRVWGKDQAVSILEAAQPASWRGDVRPDNNGFPCLDNKKQYPEEGRFVNPVHTLSAGLKLRLAFGIGAIKKKAPKPVEPTIVYVDRVVRDTVVKTNTVTVRDTVVKTNTVVEKEIQVIRDTVTIIKEVPVEIKQTMADLSNTMFDFNKSVIKEAAKGPLNKVVAWLQENPKVKVEISGHTDSKGSDEYNQKLSEARAKAVYEYFVSQGVDKFRLAYAGYGESRPIATNDTEEGRQQNRRVELNIIQ